MPEQIASIISQDGQTTQHTDALIQFLTGTDLVAKFGGILSFELETETAHWTGTLKTGVVSGTNETDSLKITALALEYTAPRSLTEKDGTMHDLVRNLAASNVSTTKYSLVYDEASQTQMRCFTLTSMSAPWLDIVLLIDPKGFTLSFGLAQPANAPTPSDLDRLTDLLISSQDLLPPIIKAIEHTFPQSQKINVPTITKPLPLERAYDYKDGVHIYGLVNLSTLIELNKLPTIIVENGRGYIKQIPALELLPDYADFTTDAGMLFWGNGQKMEISTPPITSKRLVVIHSGATASNTPGRNIVEVSVAFDITNQGVTLAEYNQNLFRLEVTNPTACHFLPTSKSVQLFATPKAFELNHPTALQGDSITLQPGNVIVATIDVIDLTIPDSPPITAKIAFFYEGGGEFVKAVYLEDIDPLEHEI